MPSSIRRSATLDAGQAGRWPKRRRTRALLRNRLSLLGLVIIAALVLVAALAPWLVRHDPYAVDLSRRLLPPSEAHWFGTDSAGQDIYSRVVHATRLDLTLSLLVLLVATTTGSALGLLSGYTGGRTDGVIMRLTEVFLAFPGLILALAMVAAVGSRSLIVVVMAIALRWWAPYARLMRAQVLAVRHSGYVEAAHALGLSHGRVLLRYIAPNSLSPIVVQATLDLGQIILTAAALSFIGLGAQPGEPEWGRMVADGREYLRTNWWVATFPGSAIFLSVLGFNLLGDGLRDYFDPRLRQTL
ncbi:MAG: ABC transporter permease [Armatimonadota bacterium]|nr:ABC transporter permease [Armatimonadota bacterium]